jgi:hypothetical protein
MTEAWPAWNKTVENDKRSVSESSTSSAQKADKKGSLVKVQEGWLGVKSSEREATAEDNHSALVEVTSCLQSLGSWISAVWLHTYLLPAAPFRLEPPLLGSVSFWHGVWKGCVTPVVCRSLGWGCPRWGRAHLGTSGYLCQSGLWCLLLF